MIELPAREDFLKHLNEKFRIFFDGEQATEAELTEVSELRLRNEYAAFSLVFNTPKTVSPEQNVYRIEHDALGEMYLLLVPFQENGGGFDFEALFNQKLKDAGD